VTPVHECVAILTNPPPAVAQLGIPDATVNTCPLLPIPNLAGVLADEA